MRRLTGLLLGALALLALLPAGASATHRPFAAVPNLPDPISLGQQSSRAAALTIRPDSNIWFAGSATDYGPAFGFAGEVGQSRVTLPAEQALKEQGPLSGIAAGPDGNLWMTANTETEGSAILRMTPAGQITSFPVGVAGTATASLRGPHSIVAGPDGALWFTAPGGDAIGRITTDGAITAYPLAANARPRSIAVGAEGKLWFTESGALRIGSITTAGTVTTYPLDEVAVPNEITLGPGGALWFTESVGGAIGKITPEGEVTEYLVENAGPIVLGPLGLLWFGSESGIGSISPRGVVGSSFCFDVCQANVEALAVAPDGKLWYGEHPVAHGGGGGNYQFTKTLFGSVGEYPPPAPVVLVGRKAEPAGRTGIRVTASCGGVAEGRCQGRLTLKLGGHVVGTNGFQARVGRSRVVRVHLSPSLRRVLRRKPTVEGRALITIAGRKEVSQNVTLQWPHARGHQARRG